MPVLWAADARVQRIPNGVTLHFGSDIVTVEAIGENLARVYVQPDGVTTPQTLVMDPAPRTGKISPMVKLSGENHVAISAAGIDVEVDAGTVLSIGFCDRSGHCIHADDVLASAKRSELLIGRDHEEPLYGMRGLERVDDGTGLTRSKGAVIAAGVQGDGGAPFFFTNHYGVLVDSGAGSFDADGYRVRFKGGTRRDMEFFVAFGQPMSVLSAITKLTGLPPMPPKWTLGFVNSQWGTSETDLERIVSLYREKKIPLDAFILDFDWKAWGEDHYGEWRWNSTSGPGNIGPNKFPNGASGAFAAKLAQQGVKLAGILKPRILVTRVDAPDQKTEAATYAEAHHLWFPEEVPEKDYVTHQLARNLDFSLPETRTWFWEHLKPSFLTGMVGWWNDEADMPSTTPLANFQFVNMARTLYEGQRAISDQRVWSLNRNYFLGANRYGYALWSGDIDSGFPSMAYQRRRMLSAMDLGASHWSMDTGGFKGHPTPENYARWLEFAAWVPIDRVHGDFDEKRQPWLYGPVAEAAATKAIRTRYSLMPYMYSYERVDHLTGIGIVRPMFWMFPDDSEAASVDTQWMFGDALLVSPVVSQGATSQHVYLPTGVWHDFNTGRSITGGRWYDAPVDPDTWSDVPVFVRDGSIVATQEPQQYVGERPVSEVALDVFPSQRPAEFNYYDDDSVSYRYEKAEYFEQKISARQSGDHTELHFSDATGTFKPALRQYIVKVHARARAVVLNGRPLSKGQGNEGQGDTITWREDKDKYGDLTVIRVPAATKLDFVLR